jgi:hypothetical protein
MKVRLLSIIAVMLASSVANGQSGFETVVLESNVLAVGEVSSLKLSGGKGPYKLSFLLRDAAKEMSIAEAKDYLVAQVNSIRSSANEVIIEFKPTKPFVGLLIVRDSTGREAKLELYSGNEKLLREFGKNPNPR